MPGTASRTLAHEHDLIIRAVTAAGKMAEALRRGRPLETATIVDLVTFMRGFADGCHHGKEEDILFPALAARGVSAAGCPLEALRVEHIKGRELVEELDAAGEAYAEGDATARRRLIDAIVALTRLYPDHIWQEDNMVIPLIDRVFSDGERAALQEAFDRLDDDMGAGTHDTFAGLVDSLEETARAMAANGGRA